MRTPVLRALACLVLLAALAGAAHAASAVVAPTCKFDKTAVADFDGDGSYDRADVDGAGGKLNVMFNIDGSTSALSTYAIAGIASVAAMDVDGDGNPDLITQGASNDTQIWINDKKGGFAYRTGAKLASDPTVHDLNLMAIGETFAGTGAISSGLAVVDKGGACDGIPADRRPVVCGYFHRMYCACISGRLRREIPPDAGFWKFFTGCDQFWKPLNDCKCWSVQYNWPPDPENCFSWLPQAGQ